MQDLTGKPLHIGKAFRDACIRQGSGKVHSTFKRVINISKDAGLLALALPEARGSHRFLTLDSLYPFEPGTPCQFNPHEFHIADSTIDLTSVPTWVGPLDGKGPCALPTHAAAAFKALLAQYQVTPGADASCPINPHTVVKWLGLGPGLTPSGDDILLGFMAFYQEFAGNPLFIEELKQSICSQLHRTTDLSAQLLRSACARDYHELIQRVIAALAGLIATPLEECFIDLLGVGASSGRDMAYGMGEALALLERESS